MWLEVSWRLYCTWNTDVSRFELCLLRLVLNHCLPSSKNRAGKIKLQPMVVKIWLNKVSLLCDLAAENPDNVTSIMDANINPELMQLTL